MSDVIALPSETVAHLDQASPTGFAQWYHDLVVVVMVSLLFSSVTAYLFSSGMFPLPPLAWIIVIGGLTAPLFFSLGTWRTLTSSRVLPWCGLYLLISAASYLWSAQSGAVVQELRTRVLAVIVLLLPVVALSTSRAVLVARRTLVACVFVAIITNVYEVFHPLTFSGIVGRSAGYYENPNSSASALVVALILSLEIVPKRYRAFYLIAGCAGVALTVSRGAVLTGLIAFGYLWHRDLIQAKRLVVAIAAAGLVVVGVLVVSGQARQILEVAQIAARTGVLDRITDPAAAMQGADNSANLRADAAVRAWEQFKLNPILGRGIGSTLGAFGLPSTHNIYLRHLAEFGFLGMMFWPLLLVAATSGANARARPTAVAFLVAMLIFGLFSHNMLDEWHCLIAVGLMSAIARRDLIAPPRLERIK